MRAAASEHRPWSRVRWASWVLCAFALQLAAVHALSLRKPMTARETLSSSLTLPLVADPALTALLRFRDPTLLALGGAQGRDDFWMKPTPIPPVNERWRDEPAWLELDRSTLGGVFRGYVQTSVRPMHGLVYRPAPLPSALDEPLPVPPLRTASFFRVEGELVERPLLTPLTPRSWAAEDVLNPSLVQVSVDGLGRVVSASLLPPGSGSEEADAYAVGQTRSLRFAPRPGSPREELRLGRVVFEWHTLPQDPAPAATP